MAIVGAGGARSAGEAVRGGADLVQVRAKELSARDLSTLVGAVIAEAGSASRVIVNSRPDIAEAAGAWGVHLPESGLDPGDVRRSFPGLAIGVSRHDRRGLEQAAAEQADYVILGPVFKTAGKETRALGLERVRTMVEGLRVPVILVGGITSGNPPFLGPPIRGVAAVGPFAQAQGAASQALAFRAVLDRGLPPPGLAGKS